MLDTTTFAPTLTVNEAIARNPETVRVFTRFGIDSCCGGGLPIAEAARRHGIALDALLDALRDASAAGTQG
jgi:regulator of cell morphogenesis and NO signaling